MTNDLEDRLRRDLPRLADAIVDAQGAATPGAPTRLIRVSDAPARTMPSYAGNVTPIDERRRRPVLLVAAVAIVVLLIGAAIALTTRDSSSTDSFATDPTLNGALPGTWTAIAYPQFEGAMDAAAVWTGSEVLLFGGHRTVNGVTTAELISAAYNPATDTWRELAEPPGMAPVVAATWAGDVAVVVSKNSGAVYDPASDSWRELPSMFTDDVAGPSQLAQPVWTGDQLLLIDVRYHDGGLGVDLDARRFDLDSWEWVQPSSFFGASGLPVDDSTGGPPPTTWDGQVTVVDLPVKLGPWASSWAFDPASNRWSGIADPPETATTAASTAITTSGGKTYRVLHTVGTDHGTVSVWVRQDTQWVQLGDPAATIQPHDSLRAVGTDDEIVIFGLTGFVDTQLPLEFDLASNTWRERIPPPALGWVGRATTLAGSKVFEWGGEPDRGQNARDTAEFTEITNAGRIWTPSNP